VIDTGPGGYGHNRLGDRYREISPLEHVSANTPPTMIFHGTADTTTPIAGIRTFRDRMTKAGNTCQLEEFQGAGHGFFNFGRGNGNAYRETTAKMIAFLKSLGYLPQR